MGNQIIENANKELKEAVIIARNKFYESTGLSVDNIKINSYDNSSFCGPDTIIDSITITYTT